jgi:hypothetical protein
VGRVGEMGKVDSTVEIHAIGCVDVGEAEAFIIVVGLKLKGDGRLSDG